MKDIVIRALALDDLPGLERLVATRPELSPERVSLWVQRMAWIAFHNPYSDGGPSYFVADRHGELVGYLGRMPTRLTGPGESFPACYVHDLYVSPICRAEGLGYPLAMALYKAVEDASDGLLVGLWTNTVNLQLKKRRGYRILEHDQFVRVLDPRPYVDRVVSWRPLRLPASLLARGGLKALDAMAGMLHRSRVSTATTLRFDAAHDQLAERLRGKTGLRTLPSSGLLNWKYVDIPGADFVCLSAKVKGDVVGYIVARATAGGSARLVDIQSDPEDRAVIAALCRAALEEMRKRGARAVICTHTDRRFVSVLQTLGFLKAPEVVHLAVRPQTVEPPAARDASRWHMGFGESDFVMIA